MISSNKIKWKKEFNHFESLKAAETYLLPGSYSGPFGLLYNKHISGIKTNTVQSKKNSILRWVRSLVCLARQKVMETFNNIFFIIFSLTLTFLRLEALHENCKKTYCNPGGPSIQFPFQLKSSQEHQNSYGEPGFVLDCENNSTIINFPSYGNLVVKSISYKTRKLDLLDPRSCVHGVFLNLNLSLTPFHYYYTLKDYTYLNCSARLSSNSFTEIPCLSGVGHHVYTVEPSLDVPFSCQPIKTIAIPFGYSSSLSDNSFGLRLTWGSLGREDCEGKGIRCALQSKNGGLTEEGMY